MRIAILLLASLFSIHSSCQVLSGKSVGVSIKESQKSMYTDTIPKVFHINKEAKENEPLIFIDGNKFNDSSINTIDPSNIKALEVKKSKNEDDGIYIHGEIHITMKEEYRLSMISLNDLKRKYVKESDLPAIFMLNNEIINDDYDAYLVDEKYILKITVEEITAGDGTTSIQFIKLFSRTKENIEKAETIRLRGNE